MKNGQLSYIKPANYEISKTRKYKSDISRIENMDYSQLGDYYICKGKKNVSAESILLAMAHNINKLHNKIQLDRTGTHLFPLKKSS